MNITELHSKIEEYRAREEELVVRQAAATTDGQRLEIERMRRILQVAALGLLDSAKREMSRVHAGRTERPAVRSQAAA
jgi:hypothetical protein